MHGACRRGLFDLDGLHVVALKQTCRRVVHSGSGAAVSGQTIVGRSGFRFAEPEECNLLPYVDDGNPWIGRNFYPTDLLRGMDDAVGFRVGCRTGRRDFASRRSTGVAQKNPVY